MKYVPIVIRKKVWARVAVCHDPAFIYVRIPKAANSTITKTLACRIFPEHKQAFIDDPKGLLAKKSFGRIGGLSMWSRWLVRKKYFIFCFFRNPYTRLLSAYLDRVGCDFSRENIKWVADAYGRQAASDVTFAEFVSLLENGHLLDDPHWIPQTLLCPFKIEELDYVGKVEDLQSGLDAIIQRIWKSPEFGGVITREHNRQHASQKLDTYYDQDLKQRVYKLYQQDFEELGYSRDW